MAVQAACPGCGAEVVFRHGAPLLVCEHCSSVVARGDRDVENLGKVVDLVDTRSPLELFLEGRYRGARFTLVGRSQLAHEKGGVWDEWYAAFDDGRWGWLAEAQGRFYMTFEVEGGPAQLPPIGRIQVGSYVNGLQGPDPYFAAEKGVATRKSAAGEIPFRFLPGEAVHFVDLTGPDGAFATLDYGSGEPHPHLYVGREVTLAELGWAGRVGEGRTTSVQAVRVACPECDGALELRAPDATQRVGCPYCGALLDADHGKLRKLKQLGRPRLQLKLPLGARGQLGGGDFVVVGFVRKATVVDGVEYTWDEYLLHDPQQGFRWLVEANGHWNFVTPAAAGQVSTDGFRRFQAGRARIVTVLGELNWKAAPGDESDTEDWVAPPRMLSIEREGLELSYGLGVYRSAAEIERAFGLEPGALPPGLGVAPNQPYRHQNVLTSFAWLLGAWLLVTVVIALRPSKDVMAQRIDLRGAEASAGGPARVWFSEPFALAGRRNVEVHVWSPVDNAWVYVEGDLVNEETGLVQGFDAAIEYYHGVESGESWREGSTEADVYLSALPAGLYVLRLEVQSSGSWPDLEVRVRQGVFRWTHGLLALLGVSLIPLLIFWHRSAFEKQRWEDSNL